MRLRLFAAWRLSPDDADAVAAWARDGLAPLPGVRLLPPALLHVTSVFLGEVDGGRLGGIEALLDGLAAGPARFAVDGAAVLGSTVSLTLAPLSPEPAAVQERLAVALAAAGIVPQEARGWLPHVAVTRIGGARRRRLELLPPPPSLTLDCPDHVLFRSELGDGPARYAVVWPPEAAGPV